jgi:hypothetical protein
MTKIGKRDVPTFTTQIRSVTGVTVGRATVTSRRSNIAALVIEPHEFTVKLLWKVRSIGVANIDQPIDDKAD